MCCYVIGMFNCERSCFSTVALVVYVASLYTATQLLVVTASFVVAANNTTLKPFTTAMGRQQPVQKRGQVEKPYEN